MISTRSVGLLIDTVVCLTLAKWETVSGRFGGYLSAEAQSVSPSSGGCHCFTLAAPNLSCLLHIRQWHDYAVRSHRRAGGRRNSPSQDRSQRERRRHCHRAFLQVARATERWQSSRLSKLGHLLMHDPRHPCCQEQRSN